MNSPDHRSRYFRYHLSRWEAVDGWVIKETPVVLNVNGVYWLTFLCTPTLLPALAVGFLYNEGLIQTRDEIVSVDVCAMGDGVDIWLTRSIEKPSDWVRTSGCSGGLTSSPVSDHHQVVDLDRLVDPGIILELMNQFNAQQHLYRKTRGVHSSALATRERLILQAEDIGRHNTLDKLAGSLLLDPPNKPPEIVLTTGRISSEMLQKAFRMGCQVVVSRTAPNSMSVRLADELGITLVGYARRDEFNVYAHPERLACSPLAPALPRTANLPGCSD